MALKALQVQHEHMFSCDIDRHVKQQILANWAPQVWFDDLLERPNHSKSTPSVDLYVAGFPCQPFSSAGKQLGFKDARGDVFFGCCRYIDAKLPQAFVLENVKKLLSNDGGKTFKTVLQTLGQLGSGAYDITWQVLNTEEHGVPQSRQRVYIVGIRKDARVHAFEWPKPLPLVSVEPLLEKRMRKPTMQDLPPKSSKTTFNNVKAVLGQLQKAGKDPLNQTYLVDIDASERFRSFQRDRCMCMIRSRPSGYWITSRGRRMTLMEMLACQGMEKTFKQVVPDRALGAQIGNAMSQNILERLFIQLLPAAGLVDGSAQLKDRWAEKVALMPASKTHEDKAQKIPKRPAVGAAAPSPKRKRVS